MAHESTIAHLKELREQNARDQTHLDEIHRLKRNFKATIIAGGLLGTNEKQRDAHLQNVLDGSPAYSEYVEDETRTIEGIALRAAEIESILLTLAFALPAAKAVDLVLADWS